MKWTIFILQEAKKIMDSLKPGMASAELRRIGLASELTAKHPTSTNTLANMQKALDSLKDEWSKVNRAYNDRHRCLYNLYF